MTFVGSLSVRMASNVNVAGVGNAKGMGELRSGSHRGDARARHAKGRRHSFVLVHGTLRKQDTQVARQRINRVCQVQPLELV